MRVPRAGSKKLRYCLPQNPHGQVEEHGSIVDARSVQSATCTLPGLNRTEKQFRELEQGRCRSFGKWWQGHTGHTCDCLAYSEARYLARAPDVDTIRDRLAAAMRAGGGPSHGRSPGSQRQRIEHLKAQLAERFPDGQPRMPVRPAPGKWQGYARPRESPPCCNAPIDLRPAHHRARHQGPPRLPADHTEQEIHYDEDARVSPLLWTMRGRYIRESDHDEVTHPAGRGECRS